MATDPKGRRSSAFFSDPDPQSKNFGKPDPESPYIFGSCNKEKEIRFRQGVTFGYRDGFRILNRNRILKFEKTSDPDSKISEQERSRSLKMWLRRPRVARSVLVRHRIESYPNSKMISTSTNFRLQRLDIERYVVNVHMIRSFSTRTAKLKPCNFWLPTFQNLKILRLVANAVSCTFFS